MYECSDCGFWFEWKPHIVRYTDGTQDRICPECLDMRKWDTYYQPME